MTETSPPRRCGDCAAKPGEPHSSGCDVARCWQTGDQRISCGEDHDHGQDVWTGMWPGEAECREFGWLTLDGRPALNRLHSGEAEWDRDARRWVKAGWVLRREGLTP